METLIKSAFERAFGAEKKEKILTEEIKKTILKAEEILIKSKNAREIINIISRQGPQTCYDLSKHLNKNYSIIYRNVKKMTENNILKRTEIIGGKRKRVFYDITPTTKNFLNKKMVLEKEFGDELVPSFIKWAMEHKLLSKIDEKNYDKIKDLVDSISITLLSSDKTKKKRESKKHFQKIEEIDWEKRISKQFDIQVHKAKIAVVGIGGAGCNTVTRLTEIGASGADIIAINSDAKHLAITKAHKKLLIGTGTTKGLGCGGYPQVGEKAAIENRTQITRLLEGFDVVFLTAGMGGGTGTGGIPVVAEIAKSLGALVISAVTMPFKMEGTRIQKAEDGLSKLRQVSDTIVVVENQKVLEYATSMPLAQAFALVDELISMMIKGITETITVPSLVNLDYSDVKQIFKISGGLAAICVGESDSKTRIKDAVLKALNHPLLEVDYSNATGALIFVLCGPDCTLAEINEAGELISKRLSPKAQVIWGARVLPNYLGKVQIISIIAGVKSPYILGPVQKIDTEKTKGGELGVPIKTK